MPRAVHRNSTEQILRSVVHVGMQNIVQYLASVARRLIHALVASLVFTAMASAIGSAQQPQRAPATGLITGRLAASGSGSAIGSGSVRVVGASQVGAVSPELA